MDTAILALRVDAEGVEAGFRQAQRALTEFEAATLKAAGAAGGALEAVKNGLTSLEAIRGLASWEARFTESSLDSARQSEVAWRTYRDFRIESARDVYTVEKTHLNEATRRHQEATGEIYGAWAELAQNMEGTLHKVFRRLIDGTADLGQTIKDWFADLIGHLAAIATTNRIVIPIMASIAGPLGMTNPAVGGTRPGGGGFGLPGMGFGFNWLNQPIWPSPFQSAWSSAGLGGLGAPMGGATWGGALSGLFGGGIMGYGMSGLPGGIFGGGLGLAGYLGGTALAGSLGLGATLGSIVPGLGTIVGGIVGGLLGKLFGGGEPDYWTESKLNIPGTMPEFLKATPGTMLQSTWLSETAQGKLGGGTDVAQEGFDTFVSAIQTMFQSLYNMVPESLQKAFDTIDTGGFSKTILSEGGDVAYKLQHHMREFLSAADIYIAQQMIRSSAWEFGKAAGLDQNAIQTIARNWIERDDKFFKSLLEKYTDAQGEPQDMDKFTAEYADYLEKFFSGISKSMTYMTADPLKDILDTINQTPIDQATEQFSLFDKQINFLMDSLNDLTGQQYAQAISNIGDLLTQRYNLEIQYISQLSSMMKGLLDSLSSQQEGYKVELMTPQEKQGYYWQKQLGDWNKFYAEADPTKAAALLTQWQQDWDKYYQLLPTAAELAANPDKYAVGSMTKEGALPSFNLAVTTATEKINTDFGGAIQDVIDGHKDTAESLSALGSATEDLKGQITAAAMEVKTFIAALRDLPNNIQITVDNSASEVGS
jgi:regulator of sigma D